MLIWQSNKSRNRIVIETTPRTREHVLMCDYEYDHPFYDFFQKTVKTMVEKEHRVKIQKIRIKSVGVGCEICGDEVYYGRALCASCADKLKNREYYKSVYGHPNAP